jgi:hypothetical protein
LRPTRASDALPGGLPSGALPGGLSSGALPGGLSSGALPGGKPCGIQNRNIEEQRCKPLFLHLPQLNKAGQALLCTSDSHEESGASCGVFIFPRKRDKMQHWNYPPS